MNPFKLFLCLLLSGFLCAELNAQRYNLDSILKILPTLRDTARVDCLIELGWQYCLIESEVICHFSQPHRDTALFYCNAALEESKKLNYLHGIALSFGPRALLKNSFLYKYGEAINICNESLSWFEHTANKKGIEFIYFMKGFSHFALAQNEEGGLNMDLSYTWAEKNRNTFWMLNVLDIEYELYRDRGEYDKAFAAFQKSHLIRAQQDGSDWFGENYTLGELYRGIGNYPQAIMHYRKIIDFLRPRLNKSNIWLRTGISELFALNGQLDSAKYYYDLIDSSGLSKQQQRFYLISMGEFYFIQKKYQEALPDFLRGLSMHRAVKDIAQSNRALVDVAKTYEALEDEINALQYAREALQICLRNGSRQNIRDLYLVMYHIFQKQHKSDSAILYYQNYISEKDLVANDLLKGKFAAYNYEQQIVQLNREAQWQQDQLRVNVRQRQFLLGGLVLLIVMGAVIMRNILLKRKNDANRREIAENALQLQKLENEKTRVQLEQQATELEIQALRAQMNPHFIFNCLSSINRFILRNESDTASDYLTKFSRLVRMVLTNSQKETILLEDELEMLRLYLNLERLRFKNKFDYRVIFHNEFDVSSIYLPPLLLQPFAENAIWHGLMHKEGTGFIEIAFSLEENYLLCVITDNGIGRKMSASFRSKTAEREKSLGIQITAKRLALLNSELEQVFFEIEDLFDETGNASGTRVVLKIQRFPKHAGKFHTIHTA